MKKSIKDIINEEIQVAEGIRDILNKLAEAPYKINLMNVKHTGENVYNVSVSFSYILAGTEFEAGFEGEVDLAVSNITPATHSQPAEGGEIEDYDIYVDRFWLYQDGDEVPVDAIPESYLNKFVYDVFLDEIFKNLD